MRGALFISCMVLAAAGDAQALSGSVSGCMLYDDRRDMCCVGQSGCAHTWCDTDNRPFREARVALVAWWGEPGSGTTDANGCFNFSWDDASCFGPTCSYTLRLFLQNPNDFTVKNASGAIYTSSTSVTIASGARALGSFKPTQPTLERWGLYATTQQFFDRIVDQSTILSATMTDIEVVYPDTMTAAWGDYKITVESSFADQRPKGVAHELGHIANRHGFGEASFDYQGCDSAHERWTPHTCERVAFEEGLATFWAMPWGWSNNATDPIFEYSEDHVESNALDNICGGSANCDVEMCVAAFLWDIFDDPANDDDPIDDADPTIAVRQMVEVLEEYCNSSSNLCRDEPGADGRNHWDFLENFDDLYPSLTSSARTILNNLSMDAACEEPF